MTEIQYVSGDATLPLGEGPKVIAHICNDVGAWGAGFVMAISRRWPEPREDYLGAQALGKNELGTVRFVRVEDEPRLWVANMIGQTGIGRSKVPPIRYAAVEQGLKHVSIFSRAHKASVHMPRIGTERAGGKWEKIEPIIQRTLVDEGVNVTVYDFD